MTPKQVEELAAELPVEKGRIYVTGISMSGYGDWDAAERRSDCYAAADLLAGLFLFPQEKPDTQRTSQTGE